MQRYRNAFSPFGNLVICNQPFSFEIILFDESASSFDILINPDRTANHDGNAMIKAYWQCALLGGLEHTRFDFVETVANNLAVTFDAAQNFMPRRTGFALLDLIEATEIQHRFEQACRPDHLMTLGVNDGVQCPALSRSNSLPLGRELMIVAVVALTNHLK